MGCRSPCDFDSQDSGEIRRHLAIFCVENIFCILFISTAVLAKKPAHDLYLPADKLLIWALWPLLFQE